MQESQGAIAAFRQPSSGPKVIFLGPKPPSKAGLEKLTALQIPHIYFDDISNAVDLIVRSLDNQKFIVTYFVNQSDMEQFIENLNTEEYLIYVLVFYSATESDITLADLLRAKEKS